MKDLSVDRSPNKYFASLNYILLCKKCMAIYYQVYETLIKKACSAYVFMLWMSQIDSHGMIIFAKTLSATDFFFLSCKEPRFAI